MEGKTWWSEDPEEKKLQIEAYLQAKKEIIKERAARLRAAGWTEEEIAHSEPYTDAIRYR